MNNVKAFLEKKDIKISRQRYLLDALSAMTLGLFSTLLIGLILQTLGDVLLYQWEELALGVFLVDAGNLAKSLTGPGIGVAVAWGLKAPPMVLFASVTTGAIGNTLGGPAGAFIAAALGAEFGKAVSKETKIDILVTPATTILVGVLAANWVGPAVSFVMNSLGEIIMWSTQRQPFVMGILVSVIMGWVLTAPISSAALAIMMGLGGLAGGAATAGCSAQMVGFAVISYSVNGVGGLLSQGIGTSMLQVPNIIKNPWILLPPTLASAITGPMATLIFKMENLPEGSGMGTSGLVGQIGTLNAMGSSLTVWVGILLLHFLLPAVLSLFFDYLLRRAGKIDPEDYRLST